ncbi:hypothetical protein A3H85_00540 [Candidatus Daviesbacteria bacterium RIFCSPLOWO2_02_FULL_40_8]|nr:MAG: hypothetical protein A2780_03860 [Candidatus Daviesbacteria bacterium RIFCSPHIGHO2_01_FULL_41_45]OGE66045.1 MAG: hypothetical protein A3H85_00540 [Candidatus Daviesbacteria bacterium RIFCSPLOWO2_02_FULL_40_8]
MIQENLRAHHREINRQLVVAERTDLVLAAHLRAERLVVKLHLGKGIRTEEDYRDSLTKLYNLLDKYNPAGSVYLMGVLRMQGKEPFRVIHQIRKDVESGRAYSPNYQRPINLS